MSSREQTAIRELAEARVFHGEDVRYRSELSAISKLDRGKMLDIQVDMIKQRRRIRRAIAIIRYERSKRG